MSELVRLLETNEPCELLKCARFSPGGYVQFAVQSRDGVVHLCNGREIERWSAPVQQIRPPMNNS
jgi:hypothetical protein